MVTSVVGRRRVGRETGQAVDLTRLPEAELIRRAQRGEAAAFGVLIATHQNTIYRLAVRTVGVGLAEDAAQQAFLQAWEGLPRFSGQAAFRTWLYRIALNCCYDALRRTAQQRAISLDAAELVVPDQEDLATNVVTAAERADQRIALAAALADLTPADRALLALRVGEGWSYEQIATTLDLNSTTVGTRLFRIRARLQRLVRHYLPAEATDGA